MPRHASSFLGGLRFGAWSGLVLGAVLAGACFDAPQPAVQFSCDPAEAPECPPGYSCEADGCCHLDGSDYAAYEGDCQLGGGGLTSGQPTTGSGSGDSSSGDASTTGAPATTGTDGGSESDGSESGSTAGTSGSSASDSTVGTSESSGTGT
jgi:hypothetical protein